MGNHQASGSDADETANWGKVITIDAAIWLAPSLRAPSDGMQLIRSPQPPQRLERKQLSHAMLLSEDPNAPSGGTLRLCPGAAAVAVLFIICTTHTTHTGRVGRVSGLAAACLEIPCSLVMPPGRHQFAPQSLGWARVCGTEKSGIWVLKGDARTYNLPRDLDDVGVVWEFRSGYETAWATPGHVCSCSYSYGRGAVLPQANPLRFYRGD